MNKYVSLTRDLIEESGYKVEFDQDGTPHVLSYKKVMANKGDDPVDPVEMRFSTRVGKQKYSTNNKPYLYVQLSLKGRRDQAYALSRVVWAWCHDECPVDMTVDHIDNEHCTPFDNRVANLQLLTHAENLAKKHSPRNQWSFMLTEEQMETHRLMKDGLAYDESELRWWIAERDDMVASAREAREIIALARHDEEGLVREHLMFNGERYIWKHMDDHHNDLWKHVGYTLMDYADSAMRVQGETFWGMEGMARKMENLRKSMVEELAITVRSMNLSIGRCRDNVRDLKARMAQARKDIHMFVSGIREEYNSRKNS